MTQKKLLANIVIIRLILIFLLVFYHSFAIYSGAWEPIEGFPAIKAYWWLDKLSYSFLLEMFVFISGFVFGYQVRIIGASMLGAKNLFIGKFKRLIIPSMVFSLLYILLLGDIAKPFYLTLYEVINGAGHLWFLPMLFWCFVGVWVIERLCVPIRIVFPLLLLCSVCPFIPLPLQLGQSVYYLLFFYSGYILQRNGFGFKKWYSAKTVVTLALSFIILFPLLTEFETFLISLSGKNDELIVKLLSHSLCRCSRVIYSSVGIAFLFCLVGYIEEHINGPLPIWLIQIGGLCMGVYIFQQFILKLAYYHSLLPEMIGPYWLPWVGFIIALLGSLLLSFILIKTKPGRLLIG